MKAIITETMRYEIEVETKGEMNRLQECEDRGYERNLGEAIAEGRAKLTHIRRVIEEKW